MSRGAIDQGACLTPQDWKTWAEEQQQSLYTKERAIYEADDRGGYGRLWRLKGDGRFFNHMTGFATCEVNHEYVVPYGQPKCLEKIRNLVNIDPSAQERRQTIEFYPWDDEHPLFESGVFFEGVFFEFGGTKTLAVREKVSVSDNDEEKYWVFTLSSLVLINDEVTNSGFDPDDDDFDIEEVPSVRAVCGAHQDIIDDRVEDYELEGDNIVTFTRYLGRLNELLNSEVCGGAFRKKEAMNSGEFLRLGLM